MASRLIINADDFGLTPGINRAIAELHQAGVLASATLMATGPAFDDAVALARTLPTLGIGCHIVLVDGIPISPPSEIPTLLGPDRQSFRSTLGAFIRDLLLGRIDQAEIAHEALAQIHTLQRAGIDVTHIDTHKHTHCFPAVARPLIDLVNKKSIACIRNPFEPPLARRLLSVPFKRRMQISLLNRLQPEFEKLAANTLTPDGTLGIAVTGGLDAAAICSLLGNLPSGGMFELCCHPGYHDADLDRTPTRLRSSREIERQALLTAIPEILSLPHAPKLIHYGNLRAYGEFRKEGL